ncbi:sugar ABC transporter permease [Peribacillus muralis]|uniref:carbohydrate ABC transporter permease n=1 Tax=Peribacillus muralis TaxID=264697 RepID=UPI001F4ECDFB|nr:sugar ABC transporter permease [Peribacillus muralis]MCK1992151.1 sugar ABC transporter permease [Peribacillus muralis]MCK2012707.1 sugar ABC transporter permease [Peribacillus muralis]
MQNDLAFKQSQLKQTHRKKAKLSLSTKRQYLFCYLFLLPQTVLYLLFTVWPVIASFYYSFFNWSGVGSPEDFVGFRNFMEVVKDSFFWNAFQNSFIYTIALVAIVVPASLIVAMILNSPKLKGAVFFRTLFFLPVVLTMAIVGIVMNKIFASENGLINEVLMNLGLLQTPIDWLGKTGTAMIALILVGVWKGFGIKVIYWLAGLQTLPAELYEAAKIDGANPIQQFRYITLPMLIPFLVIIIFFQTVWAFNVFDLVKTFTNGGPFFGTDVVPLYIYRYAFEVEGGLPRMGYASATGIVYGLATMVISIGLGLLVRKFGTQK